LRARRKPRRRRKPDRAPGDHDPWQHSPGEARRARHLAIADPPVLWHRGRRRFDGRSGASARVGWAKAASAVPTRLLADTKKPRGHGAGAPLPTPNEQKRRKLMTDF